MANIKILITNDDGISSPAIAKLAEVAKEYGEVWVVAPDGQRSAMSHRITYFGSLVVKKYDFPVEGVHAYSCSGTPADCVRVGALKLMGTKPDVVLSGINEGTNIAGDIQYSGTCGAAFEAAFWGIHAIAFSTDSEGTKDVQDKYLSEVMGELIKKPLGKNQIWNVNFPGCKLEDCKGVLRDQTVCYDDFYADDYSEKICEDGSIEYGIIAKRNCANIQKGTDLYAIMNNYVSVGVITNVR